MAKFTKIVIDHNNDTIYIVPVDEGKFDINSQMVKFMRLRDTATIEKILNEIFNRIGEGRDAFLNIELETINENHRSTESW